MIVRTPVKSSNISAIGYDPKERVLEVEFLNGGVYRHAEVPQEVYDSLMAADSKGSHYHANVKRFKATKVN